jgi:UDP:flavonoid glycosyltransferase YjiC (YdhE family)
MTMGQFPSQNGVAEKPCILMTAFPLYGHTMPMRAIAKSIIRLGFSVTFISSPQYRTPLEDIGATFAPFLGYCALSEAIIAERFPERSRLVDRDLAAFDLEHLFFRSIPSQFESIQAALRDLKARQPGKKIVFVADCGFQATVASVLSKSITRADAHITIGVLPLAVSSIDTPAFGPGLLPDSSPEGRIRNAGHQAEEWERTQQLQAIFLDQLASLGLHTQQLFYDAIVGLPDSYIQMCIPEIEYPRSDMPKNIRFAGGLPRGSRDASTSFPPFWDEIMQISKTKDKKIVGVSQGTYATLPSQLLLPTIYALAETPDILVIAMLGARNASLPPEVVIPSNVRVADFIPYDEILLHCDLFVTNGGYGAVQHAIANGTPMIVAGSSEDKPENAARVEWAGIGINLRTGTPSEEMLREAVERVLGEPSFKQRVTSLQTNMEKYDPISFIAEQIMEYGGKK